MRTQHRLSRPQRDERGAVLIIVAVFAIVAVIMVAAVVDLGGQREQRKELTLSTDAAALAAASLADTEDSDLLAVAAGTPVDCGDVGIAAVPNPDSFTDVQHAVDEYLSENGTPQPSVVCKVVRTSYKQGYVVVGAKDTVQYAFGQAVGIASGGVSGASVAAIEANPGGGLRPVAICGSIETMAGVAGYPEVSLNALAAGGSAGYQLDGSGYVVETTAPSVRTTFTVRFPIEMIKGTPCSGFTGGGSGNFGKLDFGGGTSTSCVEIGFFCKDYKDGYYGTVSNPVKGDTGNNWANAENESSTSNLEQNVGQFWAPVFSTAVGSGGNADFAITHYVQLEMVNHCFNGGCKFDGTTWFDFEVSRMIPFTTAGPPKTDDAKLRRPTLCAVDNDAAKIAAGCPQVILTSTTLPPSSSTSSSSSTSTSSTSSTSSSSTTMPCTISAINPNPATLDVGTSSKELETEVKWTVTFPSPSSCETISGRLVSGTDTIALTGAGPPSPSMTFSLAVGTRFPNGKHNGAAWSVRFSSGSATLSTTGTANT